LGGTNCRTEAGMTAIWRLLQAAGRNGRALLVLGLLAGVLLPGLAAVLRPLLPEFVALLLFLAVLRIGPRQAFGAVREFGVTVRIVLVYQLALPLVAIGIFASLGHPAPALATAVTLMLAAAPLAGSPNLTILTGFEPAPALRLVVLGTAVLPLTALAVFWLMPGLDDSSAVLASAGRLLAVIFLAAASATAVRQTVFRQPTPAALAALDGLSAITMAVVVVGLMSAIGPTFASAPGQLAFWLAVAFAANLGAQVVAALVLRRGALRDHMVPFAIVAGNRNIALFLVSLPAEFADQLLVFIGCYQIPMYMTPLIMRAFYRRFAVPRSP
jgi:hypothetical protein